MDPIDSKSELVQIMAWRRTGDKPLQPLLTKRIMASSGHSELIISVPEGCQDIMFYCFNVDICVTSPTIRRCQYEKTNPPAIKEPMGCWPVPSSVC